MNLSLGFEWQFEEQKYWKLANHTKPNQKKNKKCFPMEEGLGEAEFRNKSIRHTLRRDLAAGLVLPDLREGLLAVLDALLVLPALVVHRCGASHGSGRHPTQPLF